MQILLIEDDVETADYVTRGLVELGHQAVTATNGIDALRIGVTEHFDVIVLDRMLPGMEGLQVLRRLRAAGVQAPILVLTAKGGIADRVAGLDAGADDYLVKPFAFTELAARLNALMRRLPINEGTMRLEVGDITLDLMRREVFRAGRPLPLQPREFSILEQLMRHAGRVVTRTMLLELVWGYRFDPRTNIVESNLSRLRTRLREGGREDPVETVRGHGYRMRTDD